jgi:arsenite methyltransferase
MQGDRPIPADDSSALRDAVRAYYAARIETGSCCGPALTNVTVAADLDAVPSFGCGDPAGGAGLVAGEQVLDLGSGAGFDALRAAAAVGPSGRVIGVDMTPAMVARARQSAARLGVANVEFREGVIEALPLPDESIDVVLSNCVLNLTADVSRALREAARVLRPGGRLHVSDTFRTGPPPPRPDVDGWCACEDGAHDSGALVRAARGAGLVDVRVEPAAPPVASGATYGAVLRGTKPRLDRLTTTDLERGAELLAAAGLPLAAWESPGTHHWGAFEGGRLCGVIALGVYGGQGLLRSLAVAPGARGRGFAHALLGRGVDEARRLGLASLAARTTTIPQLLATFGFREVAATDIPLELHASPELRGACPDTARAFLLELGADAPRG